jgi:Cu/Ag efflux pump CusA
MILKRFWLLLWLIVLGGLLYFFGRELFQGVTPEQIPVEIHVVSSYPGASAEEVERQVTIPLEVALAGLPRLERVRSRSFFAHSELSVEFRAGTDYFQARQEVINRLGELQALPPGVAPLLFPVFPGSELVRYTLSSPRDAQGRPIYSPRDLRELQSWVLEREFRRVPRIVDVTSHGGTVKRYEVQPDPERLRRYGITLQQVSNTLSRDGAGRNELPLLGRGGDSILVKALAAKDAKAAAAVLRSEEDKRLRELRDLVIASVNEVLVKIEDVVEGGRLREGQPPGEQGVIVGQQPHTELVIRSRPRTDAQGREVLDPSGKAIWEDEECVQGIVELRWGEDGQVALADVRDRIQKLNESSGRLLPGVRLEVAHERTEPSANSPLWIFASFPGNASMKEIADTSARARSRMRQLPEVGGILTHLGRANGVVPLAGSAQACFCVRLRPGGKRGRAEIAAALEADLSRNLVGIDWRCADSSQADLMEAFLPGQGEGVVKIFGSDNHILEQVAGKMKDKLVKLPEVVAVRVLPLVGKTSWSLRIDPQKCARWGVRATDVREVLEAALAGKGAGEMSDGVGTGIVVRWPARLRNDDTALLNLPVDAGENVRLTLGQLVVSEESNEKDVRSGVAVIYRENGKRFLPLRVRARPGKQLADVMQAAQEATRDLLPPGYTAKW